MSTNGCLRLLGIDPNAKDDEVSEEEIRMMVDVGSENADNIIGVLKAKEYFRLEDKSRESVMRYAVRDPYFVPATIKADRLFRNMKKGRRTMAVVLDEYGGMMGVITVKDLIEQLVGDYCFVKFKTVSKIFALRLRHVTITQKGVINYAKEKI